ncbi:disease resistance protein RPV1-like isoform X2 [Cornus florida]|uniref:disease resistance protein RPV1-like isoform X2 n=1 Tax=Cornus florida TaxID=4283 RepID=UPI00289CF401|nr:disease resistance protein RPV1-like isoform X2 [Cornus florida]
MAASCVYDVFLSFSGVDTRKKFTGHLLAALDRHGFNTFRDDTKLTRGEEIGPRLLKAIEESRVSLIVFSENYASSRWCLEELVKIMYCKRTLNQIVIPIFYDVQPFDVRSQRGCYTEAFASHEKQFNLELVRNWRLALAEAANLSGYGLQNVANGCESTFIEIVVGEVADKLNPTCLSVADCLVGIQHHLEKLSLFLKLGSNSDDVRIVAIWGIGGIGKTTIAKAMYNRIHRHHEFESSSFLANIGQTSKQPNGLVELQEKLLCDLLMDGNQRIRSEDHGIEVIKRRAWSRKVLLVLDDVDNISQMRALAINRDLLSPGSRIIVTTRDLSSLSSLRMDEVYMPKELNEEESLQLFSWHAFRRDHPVEDYEILSKEVVSYAKGLPLVLEILGSFLSDKAVHEWSSELKKLKKIPHHDVQGKLALSFNSLDDEQKGLFLHIAFFLVGMNQDFSIKILEGCGFFPESGIGVLSCLCLVRIDQRNRLMMHDLIQDMAREIVRQESPEEPGERSRLWYRADVLDVLRNNTGTKAIQGLFLNLPESEKVKLNAKAFTKMDRLRLLHLNNVHLSGSYKHISGRLVWLSWKGFSSKYVPSTLIMDNLVAIDLSYSHLKQVWKGTKVLCRLKYLNLGHSYLLIKTPDFTGFTSLEELLLNDCTKLVEVHQSIGCLKNLLVLNMKNCQNLEKVPLSIFMLKHLLYFNLSGCSKLVWPTFFQRSPPESSVLSLQLSSSIRELSLKDCNITYVPSEIGSLVFLEILNLGRNKFSNLPTTITSLPKLKSLSINQCNLLESVPALPLNLLRLNANYCTSLQSISMESKLAKVPFMTFYGCPKLVYNFTYNFRRNLLHYQGLREQGEFNIFLPGSELPRWCNYQREGRFTRFLVRKPVGRIIQGLILCVLFTSRGFNQDYSSLGSVHGRRCDLYHASFEDQMWLSYIPLRCLEYSLGGCYHPLNHGDEVEIEIRAMIKSWRLKKCRVSLVYEGDDKCYENVAASDVLPVGENVTAVTNSKFLDEGEMHINPTVLPRIIEWEVRRWM